MKRLLLSAILIFLIFTITIPEIALPEEPPDVSETYSNFPCEEQWNLHSDKFKKGMKNDWDVLKVIAYEFIDLSQQGKLPGLSSDSANDTNKYTFFKLNQRLFDSLKSKSPVFSNLAEELGEDEVHYLAEVTCDGKEFKYFVSLSPQSEVEIKSVYVNEDGSWERLAEPLFADSPELAEALFLSLKSGIKPAESFYLDTPEVNRAAITLAERYNMKVVFETARMYTGEKPDMPLNRLFGVTSFELG